MKSGPKFSIFVTNSRLFAFHEFRDGRCHDINECITYNDQFGTCKNTEGSFTITCEQGFKLQDFQGGMCLDINECESGVNNCAYKCMNTIGSYNCYCDGDSKLAENGRDCVPRRVLKCESGFEVQGGVCVDVDECQGDHGCGFNCRNLEGSYQCVCDRGYELLSDALNCADIDECATGRNVCRQRCVNDHGSYSEMKFDEIELFDF